MENVFNTMLTYIGAYATMDQFQVGDLTGKHGTSHSATVADNNLPLFTSFSVAGRGVTVTNVADNS